MFLFVRLFGWLLSFLLWGSSLRKHATYPYFPAKWGPRNEPRNSILMRCHYPELGSASEWAYREGNFLQLIRSTTLDLGSDASSVSQTTEEANVRKNVCVYTTWDNAFDVGKLFAVKTKIQSLSVTIIAVFYWIYHLTVSLLDRTNSKKIDYVFKSGTI